MCKHVVDSAGRFGEDGGIRVGCGDGRERGVRSIKVGTGMLGGAVGGAAGRFSGKVEAGKWLWCANIKDGRRAHLSRAARW